jgi:hypothetical protein
MKGDTMSDERENRQVDESTAPGPEAPRRAPSSGGRTAGLIASSILGLFGLAILIGGLALIAVHAFARDDDGFYSTGSEQLHSAGYALATDQLDFGASAAGVEIDDLGATIRLDATSANAKPLFIGIGPTTDVVRYLDGVAYSEIVDFGDGKVKYAEHDGGRPPGPPDAEEFWVAKAQGVGEQRLDWDVGSGNYTAVAMNAAGARGVDIDADAGGKVSWLLWVGVGLTVIGLLLVGATIVLISRLGRRPETA